MSRDVYVKSAELRIPFLLSLDLPRFVCVLTSQRPLYVHSPSEILSHAGLSGVIRVVSRESRVVQLELPLNALDSFSLPSKLLAESSSNTPVVIDPI